MYEVMRHCDKDWPETGTVDHGLATVWRAQPKWLVSRSLKSVGANATLVETASTSGDWWTSGHPSHRQSGAQFAPNFRVTAVGDGIEAVIRGLKAQLVGEMEVAGPDLTGSLTDLGLIDEYRLYFCPFVLGRGKPFFVGPWPQLRLVFADPAGEGTVRLTCVPA